ncbi:MULTISPECIES: cytochrome P450 [unclassified Streptomyces]|uniref:cytochrome P450 n=1 Tax=unclassified Streptomyces TaxID=2593676 RepID=UPI000B813CE5|nr:MULTISPECIES: cytochrome P450 [unclassified Streptomyces]MYS23003.1 cytochrome P450 [Streptomyces sp. SID4948]
MARNRLEVMTQVAARYGDAARLPLGPKTLYFFNSPEHAKHVLADNPGNFHKGIGLVHARRVLGDGLLTSEGELWKSQRRTMQPVFQAKRINLQLNAVADEAERLAERLRGHIGHGSVDVRKMMTELTLGVLGRTLLATDLSEYASMGDDFEAVQNQAMFEMMSLNAVPGWVPLPRQTKFRRARRSLEDVVARLRAERLEHPTAAGDDVVSRLIQATNDEPDRAMAMTRMRDELVTLLLAGHETTASTLSWAFYLIDRHPEVARRLHEEAAAVLGGGPLSLADLHSLTYTTRVLEEVMRLYPPVWILPRLAQEDDEIGGYRVPSGADVLICPYTLHRHPGHWDRPDDFDPDRFEPARSAGRARYAYIPFGAGPRFCVGNNLGMMEATIVLATVARDLRLTAVSGYRARPEPMLTLRIRGGLPMTVHAAG